MSDQVQELKPCFTYCRVSSRKQVTEGNGLSSQLQECKEYAKKYGYMIMESFQDEAISGGNRQREGIDLLLVKCKENPNLTVLFPSTSRLARDVIFLLSTVDTLTKDYNYDVQFFNLHGVDMKTDAGWLMLTMMGGQDEFMRKSNLTTAKERSKARLQQGYWFYGSPLGYDNSGKSQLKIMQQNDKAPVVKELLEDFANGNYSGCAEVQKYLRSLGINKRQEDVKDMLTNPLYAGFIHKPNQGVDMYDPKNVDKKTNFPKSNALHKPIIDLNTYLKILERINKSQRSAYMKNNNNQFIFKRCAKCSECQNFMTTQLKKKTLKNGSVLEWQYYACPTRGCNQQSKTIRSELIELEVLNYLSKQVLSLKFIQYLQKYLGEKAKNIQAENQKEIDKIKRKIKDIEIENETAVAKILLVDSPALVKAIEKKSVENNNKILEYKKELIKLSSEPKAKVGDVLNLCLDEAIEIDKRFNQANNTTKKKLLNLLFPEGFVVYKKDDKVVVLNQQKSPLLRDFWGELDDEFVNGAVERI